MKKFTIVTNTDKDTGMQVTKRIKSYLEGKGATCTLCQEGDEICGSSLDKPDCVLVLGGDGTLLRAAREILQEDIPLIGVNLGTMGYLAEVEQSGLNKALSALLEDKYSIEERMMLFGKTEGEEGEEGEYALNDIAITRSGSLEVLTLHIFVNGQFLNTYHADGILLSTPTGSTGYNLSAGGPIVEPSAKLILLTPICPHTLNTRTIVLSPDDSVVVEIGESRTGIVQHVEACFDGSRRIHMQTGDRMQISGADKKTLIVKLSQASFLEVLHKKMNAD